MSILRHGVWCGCVAALVFGFSSAAQAEGWNPFSVFKKKPAAPAYRPVVPASAQLPIKNALPSVNIPSFPQVGGSAAPANFVDKWNAGAQNNMEKMRKALTLPKIKLPTFDGNKFSGGQVQNENPFLKPLTNKLPFGQSTKAAKPRKSLIPSWLSLKPAKQPQQPATLQDWLAQPRPQ